MNDEGVLAPLAPPGRGEPISDEEAEELVEFFCGREGTNAETQALDSELEKESDAKGQAA